MNRSNTPALLLILCWLSALMGCHLTTIYGETEQDQAHPQEEMGARDRADAGTPPVDMSPKDLGEDLREVVGDASPDLASDMRVSPITPDLAHDMGVDMARAPFDPRIEPMHVLFIGNSFTHQGPVPTLVEELATAAGWPTPYVTFVAPGGKSLAYHRENPDTLNAVDAGGWHAVVLQDFSTRPTDDAGDPEAFKQDALWFFERVQASSPDARVVLYMTWARHPDHSFYPGTFSDPDAMQDQLATHYRDAANRVIPEGSAHPNAASLVEVSPVGEVWRHQLSGDAPLRLHDTDNYHANTQGRWLNALTLYATLYHRRVLDLPISELELATRQKLYESVDAVHPQDLSGGPDGEPFTPLPRARVFEVSDRILIDFGASTNATSDMGWNNVHQSTSRLDQLVERGGAPTTISYKRVSPFSGTNEAGSPQNAFGYPAAASKDSLWSGVLGGTHEEALQEQATIRLEGLEAQGAYRVLVFASRVGADTGFGRLGRYQIGAQMVDFEATDNQEMQVIFERVVPGAGGEIDLTISVSPDGGSRYAYINALEIERIE